MPLTCLHCGSQNPEGLLFCQQCGTPLAAAPGSTPPSGATLPAMLGPAPLPATSPASPVQHAASGHRLPLGSILGLMIGAIGLLAAIAVLTSHGGAAPLPPQPKLPSVTPGPSVVPNATGTALAHRPAAQPTSTALAHRPTVQPTGTVVPLPTATTAVSQPSSTPESLPALTPTSGGSGLPGQPTTPPGGPGLPGLPTTPPSGPGGPGLPGQPTTPPSGPSGPGQTLNTSTFSVQVPNGWQVANEKTTATYNSVNLQDPSTAPNTLIIEAGATSSPVDVQTVLQAILQGLQQQYPDAQQCGQSQQTAFGGMTGTLVPICFTFTPQGGAAIPSVDLAWASVSTSGTYFYSIEQIAGQSNQPFFTHAGDVTNTVQWVGGQ
jgi:hypothetical protein